jgi:hypothetical protein
MRVLQQPRNEEPDEIKDGKEPDLLLVEDARLNAADQACHRLNTVAATVVVKKQESSVESVAGSGWAHHNSQQHKYIQELLMQHIK